MDAEQFEAWKGSTATQEVLLKLAEQADAIKLEATDGLFYSTGNTPADWAAMQARIAFDRGRVAGINFLVALTYEEIDDSSSET